MLFLLKKSLLFNFVFYPVYSEYQGVKPSTLKCVNKSLFIPLMKSSE